MKLHLQRQGATPGGIFRNAARAGHGHLAERGTNPGFEPVDIAQIDIADRRRPDIEIVRSGIRRRLTRDGARIVDDDVDAFRSVIAIKGAAGDLRVVDFGVDPIEVLDDLEIEVGEILRAPEADLGTESAIRLDRHFGEFLPTEQVVRDQLAPEGPQKSVVGDNVRLQARRPERGERIRQFCRRGGHCITARSRYLRCSARPDYGAPLFQ